MLSSQVAKIYSQQQECQSCILQKSYFFFLFKAVDQDNNESQSVLMKVDGTL